jgi:hypothetical protein
VARSRAIAGAGSLAIVSDAWEWDMAAATRAETGYQRFGTRTSGLTSKYDAFESMALKKSAP